MSTSSRPGLRLLPSLLICACLSGTPPGTPTGLRTISKFPQLPSYVHLNEKIQSGAAVEIAFMGGSISVGGVTYPNVGEGPNGPYDYSNYELNEDSWRARLVQIMQARLAVVPDQFSVVRAYLGGTNSEFTAYRFAEHIAIPNNPDLLIIEFTANDVGVALQSNDPWADGSIYRTLKSIITQAQARNPDIAIILAISSMRDFYNDTLDPNWREKFAVSREHYIRAGISYEIPYADITVAYYDSPLPPGSLMYNGPVTPINRVHPSPEGHEVYAQYMYRTLRNTIRTGRFFFQATTPLPDVPPYPLDPVLIPAEDLITSPDLTISDEWEFRVNEESWNIEPIHTDKKALFVNDERQVMDLNFQGRDLAIWWEWRFHGGTAQGRVEVRVDDQLIGTYVAGRNPGPGEKSLRRYLRISHGLDPGVEHTLQIIIPNHQPLPSEELRIALHGICLDR